MRLVIKLMRAEGFEPLTFRPKVKWLQRILSIEVLTQSDSCYLCIALVFEAHFNMLVV